MSHSQKEADLLRENTALKALLDDLERDLKAYRNAVDAQPWATDEPIRVLLDRITKRMTEAERKLAQEGGASS